MNVWKITAPQKLSQEDAPVPDFEREKIRVRVTKVLLSSVDAELFNGTVKPKYPIIPGRFAIGQVSQQTENSLFPKGTRVLFNTYREAPNLGTAKKDFSEDEVDICGFTKDGFLRDFINAVPDEITPLPDSVTDNDALLVHYVAVAKATVDKLGAKKGSHIAVVGADLMGILVCLLLIYQQAAPILIDSHADRLYFAKKCGVYYTMQTDDNLIDEVASVTGGRLADGAVFVTTAGENAENVFSLTSRGKDIVVCASDRRGFTVNVETAIHKQLTVHAVSDPEGSLETAINLIVSKAINLDPIRSNVSMIPNVERYFRENGENAKGDLFRMHVVQLI